MSHGLCRLPALPPAGLGSGSSGSLLQGPPSSVDLHANQSSLTGRAADDTAYESSAFLGQGNTVNVNVIAATIRGEHSRWSKACTQGSRQKQSGESTERLQRLSGNS